MITLYARPTCPFCARVRDVLNELNISYEEKDITDPAYAAELVNKGGKQQVPYLVDDERGVAMYESGDIVEYLKKTFGQGNS